MAISLVKNNPYSINKIGTGIAGAAELYGQAAGIANSDQYVNAQIPTPELGVDGFPAYNLSNYAQAAGSIHPKGATGGQVLGATASGAATGASVGGPYGALIGGAVGAGSALIGGGIKKHREENALDRANATLAQLKSQYNRSTIDATNNYLAKQSYLDQIPKSYL